jgi:hypothetical protein
MKPELSELYCLMMVDERDRKTFPNAPTAANRQAIRAELKSTESQMDARLSIILGSARI